MDKANVIPVVFAANDRYTPYTAVAISSLIFNCSPNFTYRIYVLNRDITEENVRRLESLSKDHVFVKCVNVSERIKEVTDFRSLHLTQETIYRLLIPELFSQYEKVIYLDSDLVVVGDISELYQYDIDGYLLAAAHDGYTIFLKKYYQKNLGFSAKDAFNAGVLLMNLPLLREKEIESQCLRLLEEDAQREEPKYVYLDQDVLNLTCGRNVFYLDTKWNLQHVYLRPECHKMLFPEYKESILEAEKECRILHYASEDKPWKCFLLGVPKEEEFWKVAKQTIFYEELCQRYQDSREKVESEVPLCNVAKGARIVLYGAGNLGNYLWRAFRHLQYCQVVL